MAKPQKPKRKKTVRKKFFEVSIPLTSVKVHLYSYSPEDLVNNIVKIDLTKMMRGKNVELRAKVKLDNGELVGVLTSLQLLPIYLRRVIRRGTDYVEDSFEVNCKDSKLRIKPFMITRKRVSRAVRKAIRDTAKKHLESKIKVRTTKEIFSEIMTNKLQKELSLKIKKIYPLSLCEIRMLNVIEYLKKEDKSNTKSSKTTTKVKK